PIQARPLSTSTIIDSDVAAVLGVVHGKVHKSKETAVEDSLVVKPLLVSSEVPVPVQVPVPLFSCTSMCLSRRRYLSPRWLRCPNRSCVRSRYAKRSLCRNGCSWRNRTRYRSRCTCRSRTSSTCQSRTRSTKAFLCQRRWRCPNHTKCRCTGTCRYHSERTCPSRCQSTCAERTCADAFSSAPTLRSGFRTVCTRLCRAIQMSSSPAQEALHVLAGVQYIDEI
ncbi:hypothetical protein BIW11_11013, partial [Tropilaelaps mercedesae]